MKHIVFRSTLLLLALCLTTSSAYAEEEKKVRIKKLIVLDGEHDGKQIHRVFIDEDGERHELGADHHFAWIADHHRGSGTFLGVQLSDLTPELRAHFGAQEDSGVMVSKVVDDSPAMKAGVQVGDIISTVDGESVTSGAALARAIRGHEDGDSVVLEVYREGRITQITTALEVREGMGAGPMQMHHRLMSGSMPHVRQIMVRCDDGEDCDFDFDYNGEAINLQSFDCGSEECEVKVECNESGCDCTVNGESRDCSEIPGVHELHN